MKVTSVETVVVDGGMRNWVLVLVDTDEGVPGLGEATLEGKAETVVAAVGELARYVVGEDASRIQHLWQSMYRNSFWRGGPALMSAISGIEQALWDIAGKSAGLPVYALLGGACRDAIPLYANGPRGTTPSEYAASARAIVDAGFTAMKVAPLEATLPVDSSVTVRRAAACVGAIRDEVGPDVAVGVDVHGRLSPAMSIRFARELEPLDIWFLEEPVLPENAVAMADVAVGVDVHGRLSPAMSIRFARELEPLDIWFLEEPVLPENAAAMADVARATSIPIATGERLFTKWGFRDVVELRAAALLQPDVSHCGGILEARLIAALGETIYAGFAPHNPLSPVNTVASAHVGMATPSFVALEHVVDNPPWTPEILTEPLAIRNGTLELPKGPGLGIELDLDACRAHPYRPVDLPAFRQADGAVADW
jgi:galactonate dehydratase